MQAFMSTCTSWMFSADNNYAIGDLRAHSQSAWSCIVEMCPRFSASKQQAGEK